MLRFQRSIGLTEATQPSICPVKPDKAMITWEKGRFTGVKSTWIILKGRVSLKKANNMKGGYKVRNQSSIHFLTFAVVE